MDGDLDVEADRDRVIDLRTQSVEVLDVEVDGIQCQPRVGLRGQQRCRPHLPGDVSQRPVRIPVRSASERGEQILRAPHHPDGVVCLHAFGDLHRPERRFDQHDHLARRQCADLLCRLTFRQHHRGVVGALQGLQVGVAVGGVGGVDPHDRLRWIQRRFHQRPTSALLVCGGDTVLEVEDDHVGDRGGLREAFRAIGRAEQPGRTDLQRHEPSGFVRTNVLRVAAATMSPC